MTRNTNSIVQHVIQTKNGIIVHANASVKGMVRAKQIIVEILAYVFVRIEVFKTYCWWFSNCMWWNCKVANSVLINVTNIIPTNTTKIISTMPPVQCQ